MLKEILDRIPLSPDYQVPGDQEVADQGITRKPAAFLPLGYSVARGNDELLRTLNAWLGEQKAKGTVDELYRYWMLGQAAKIDKPPRCSVIRDVLGWVN